MFRDKKTQFAIRKLTTGTGILLLSVGMGINLSSKEVSASEIDPAQTTETVQTEAATELTAEQEPAVEFSAPVQETEGTSTVESTPNVKEETVTEIPAETVTGNTNNENNGSVNTGTQSPATQPEAEKPGQDTTATDNTNNENKDAVNTETQKPETTTPATQPETDKAEEGEKTPAKNETDSSSEKEESKADSDKKDEVEKNENELNKGNIKDDAINIDGSILPDAAKPDKDNINETLSIQFFLIRINLQNLKEKLIGQMLYLSLIHI